MQKYHPYAETIRKFSMSHPEFMVETLRVGIGYCSYHLLYRNVWTQVKYKNRILHKGKTS